MDFEYMPVSFDILFDRIILIGIGALPPWVDLEHIDARFSFDYPFRQIFANASGQQNTKGIAFGEPEIW